MTTRKTNNVMGRPGCLLERALDEQGFDKRGWWSGLRRVEESAVDYSVVQAWDRPAGRQCGDEHEKPLQKPRCVWNVRESGMERAQYAHRSGSLRLEDSKGLDRGSPGWHCVARARWYRRSARPSRSEVGLPGLPFTLLSGAGLALVAFRFGLARACHLRIRDSASLGLAPVDIIHFLPFAGFCRRLPTKNFPFYCHRNASASELLMRQQLSYQGLRICQYAEQ